MTEHDAIEQLAALLDGEGEPETAPALSALATLATTVRDHSDVLAPSAEFRASLREQLVAAAEPQPSLTDRLAAAWSRRATDVRTRARLATAALTASSMLGSAGVAVAAQDALPGELLYPVKGATEQVRLLLATDDLTEARLHLAFARERLEELEALRNRLSTDEIADLLARMDEHSEKGAQILLDGAATGSIDASEVALFADEQLGGLESLLTQLPLLAQRSVEDSIELLRRIERDALGTLPAVGARSPLSSGDLGGVTPTIPAPLALDATTAVDAQVPATRVATDRNDARIIERIVTGRSRDGKVAGSADDGDDCDCIELPQDDSPILGGGSDDEAPREDPFTDDGDETENPDAEDDTGSEGGVSLGVSDQVEVLPTDEVADAVETATGQRPDTSPVKRTAKAFDATTEDLTADAMDPSVADTSA